MKLKRFDPKSVKVKSRETLFPILDDPDNALRIPRPKEVPIPFDPKKVKTMKNKEPVKKYAKGGSVSSRADGVAKKGRTNCKYPKMAGGGKMGKGC